jgi:hypothetical protein
LMMVLPVNYVRIRGVDRGRLETVSAGQIASRVIARQRNSVVVRLGVKLVNASAFEALISDKFATRLLQKAGAANPGRRSRGSDA